MSNNYVDVSTDRIFNIPKLNSSFTLPSTIKVVLGVHEWLSWLYS